MIGICNSAAGQQQQQEHQQEHQQEQQQPDGNTESAATEKIEERMKKMDLTEKDTEDIFKKDIHTEANFIFNQKVH